VYSAGAQASHIELDGGGHALLDVPPETTWTAGTPSKSCYGAIKCG